MHYHSFSFSNNIIWNKSTIEIQLLNNILTTFFIVFQNSKQKNSLTQITSLEYTFSKRTHNTCQNVMKSFIPPTRWRHSLHQTLSLHILTKNEWKTKRWKHMLITDKHFIKTYTCWTRKHHTKQDLIECLKHKFGGQQHTSYADTKSPICFRIHLSLLQRKTFNVVPAHKYIYATFKGYSLAPARKRKNWYFPPQNGLQKYPEYNITRSHSNCCCWHQIYCFIRKAKNNPWTHKSPT